MTYDLRNHFPYELNFESKFKDNLFGNVCISVSTVLSILFFIFFDETHLNGFLLFAMIAGIVNSLIILSLVFVPLKLLKAHLILVTVNIALSFLVPFSLAMAASFSYSSYKEVGQLVFIILPALICIFIFILIMNPKLTKWALLDKKTNPDGSVSYVRPKIFILAFTEWLLFFSSVITEIIALLIPLFIK